MATHEERNRARWEALNECADHLDLAWTDDPIEREEGIKVGRSLRRMAEKIPLREPVNVRRLIKAVQPTRLTIPPEPAMLRE